MIKQKSLDRPLLETPTSWITVGYNTDLNKALYSLKAETIAFIMQQRSVSHEQAEKILYATWNCPISEVVNGVQGVYCILPKQRNALPPAPLPIADTATRYVTYAKDPDIEVAMKKASWAMLQKIVSLKKLTLLDAYSLASIAMDCRISPYKSGDKEVHCMLDKKLWRH